VGLARVRAGGGLGEVRGKGEGEVASRDWSG
jgi:hypothetical protein